MDPYILTSIAGFGTGIVALVRSYRNGNGNGHNTNGSSPSEPGVDYKLVNQVLQDLNMKHQKSVQQLADNFSDLVAKVACPPMEVKERPNPEWVKSLETRLAAHTAALVESREAGWTQEATQAVERVVERLEAVLQMGPPAPDYSQLEDKFNQLAADIMAYAKGQLPQGPRFARRPRRAPPMPADDPIFLEMYNTLYLKEHRIYELIPPEADIYDLSVMNLGPGVIFMRAPDEPEDYDDPKSTTIPEGSGDNIIGIPRKLFVLCDDDGARVSARLSFSK